MQPQCSDKYIIMERERERETDRERQRETETDRQTDRDTERQRQTDALHTVQCTVTTASRMHAARTDRIPITPA